MRAARKIIVGGALIAAIALEAWGWWAASPATAQTTPAGRCAVATAPLAGGTQMALPVQGPGIDSMAGKKRRRSG